MQNICDDSRPPPTKRTVTRERIAGILEEVQNVQKKTGKTIGLSLILPQDIPVSPTESDKPVTNAVSTSLSSVETKWCLKSPVTVHFHYWK